MQLSLQPIAQLFFKLTGWNFEVAPDTLSDAKQVAIGFPHTTNMDGIRAALLFHAINLPYHIMVKKELFVFPLTPLLKKFGCVPVDRNSAKNAVQQMAELFTQFDQFTLVIAPEGTRTKGNDATPPIRTGFWHIAQAANTPIVLAYSDSKTKQIGLFAKVYPTGNIDADLAEIQRLYATKGVHVELPTRTD